MKCLTALTVGILGMTSAAQVAAQVATRVNVRVVSHDAKIIGDGVGGARVTVRDPASGRVLAQGTQQGGTGDTGTIVVDPHRRGETPYDTEGAAVLTVELMLHELTVVEFVGEGPLGYEHSMQRAVKRMLLMPGEHILGDGVLLELHGFIVELEEHAVVSGADRSIRVTASVRMMCGCPHTPGGLWEAERIKVLAWLYGGDRAVRQVPLGYAGQPNQFSGVMDLTEASDGWFIVVTASDPDRANFGMSRRRAVR